MSEWTPWQVAQCMKRLEDMEAILMLSEFKARLEADAQVVDDADVLSHLVDCGDGLCAIRKPSGQHTNGGCRCSPSNLRCALYSMRSAYRAACRERDEVERLTARVTELESIYDFGEKLEAGCGQCQVHYREGVEVGKQVYRDQRDEARAEAECER